MNKFKNNKLIAEFMGMTITKDKDNGCELPIELSHYHESWDWLMPVVEKIVKLGYFVMSCSNYSVIICETEDLYIDDDNMPKIRQAIVEIDNLKNMVAHYKAIVEFIKWYNEKQKKETNN